MRFPNLSKAIRCILIVSVISTLGEPQIFGQSFLNAYKSVLRPQEPKGPFPYNNIEVEFFNHRDSIKLAGTLSITSSEKPSPAVILVSGSGSQNRDEELYGHKPFAVIADYLTRNGIAVLRFDDRGIGGSELGNPQNVTSIDLSYDAESALDYLLSRDDIDNDNVGIIGHSEGGMINWMIASRRQKDVKFVISLAGTSIKGSEVLRTQQRAIYKASGIPEVTINANEQLFDQIWKIVENNEEIADGEKELRKYLSGMGATEEQIQVYCDQLLIPWMYEFIKMDPRPFIEAATCPGLVLNGTKDTQVVAETNIPVWEEIASNRGESSKITIQVYEGLNHLFQHCEKGNPEEYQQIKETISPEILDAMKDYILSIVKR